MLPYIPTPAFELGSYRVDVPSLFFGAAIVVQFLVTMRRTRRAGIDPRTASALIGWATAIGLVSAHVFDVIVYYPDRFARDPLALLRFWDGVSSFGGMLGGLAGLAFVMQQRGLSTREQLRFVDCLLYALPFTLAVGRLGCALLHDHPGASSQHALAVAFPEGPRFDLGLLECFYTAALAALFAALGRSPRPDGFFIGLFFAAYGPVRFALDALRVSEARYFGWTPGQYLSLVAAGVGVWTLWLALRSRRTAGSA